MPEKLWTRDFTILTLGTVVSMLGNSVAGFAISLLVLDYTGSTFLYALFMVVYNLPKVVMPLLAGPYLDRFSRKKAIYTLDFISAALYLGIFFFLRANLFNYPIFLFMCLFIGSIDGVYEVAYDSLYPTLVSEGNYRRAYSISSMIYPLAAVMVPVAAWCYARIGLTPLFAFNAATFLIAAIFETQIQAPEPHIKKEAQSEGFRLSRFRSDFKEGVRYIRSQPGLLVITAYFFCTSITGSASDVGMLPYFKNTPSLGVLLYTIVMGAGVFGRLVGGGVHYRFKYPAEKKFAIALWVYIISTVLTGGMLYLPIVLMTAASFAAGLLQVTSYNIRISGTQSYVPNDHRGRFNGVFLMFNTLGMLLGQLSGGALLEFFPTRPLIAVLMGVNLLAIGLIMVPGRKHVKVIYNQNL